MLGERCSHGKTWAESCPECDLISAREIEVHWGEMVDEARKVIAKATTKRIQELKKEGFML
ncbi:hypothetical protein [Paraburkholderia sp. RL18-085-BIA-A]|uniref:hypothetical protein n=1 Tax=Paraburkholderia sp. RL18-085-BIA-A TaxID=3031633 RepID=UPI0038B846A9